MSPTPSRDALLWLALGGLAVLTLVLLVLVVTTRRALRTALTATRAEIAALRTSPTLSPETSSEAGRPVSAPAEREYVITGLGHDLPDGVAPPTPVINRAVFTDMVLRESVVRTASLAHGVRRALAPEARNRIRFEMRQEVRRSRKQRRVDLKTAQRHLRAEQRARLTDVSDLSGEAS